MVPRANQDEKKDPQNNPVNGKGGESAGANPAHEPGNHSERDHQGNEKADREHDPVV